MSSSKGGGASAVPAVDRINAELLTLTYGALVRHLLLDLEAVSEVNKQLDDMGYRMGVRLIDDFLAKTSTQRCRNLREAARVVAEVALKMYLGVSAQVVGWNADGTECSLVMRENPLVDFVELPEDGKLKDLSYCNLICGCIRGALEQVSIRVNVDVRRDPLKGDDALELRIKLHEYVSEEYPFKDD